MATAFDSVLRRRVEAESCEDHIVVASAVRVADHFLHLHRRHITDLRADTHSNSPFLFVTVHPIAFCMNERRSRQWIQAPKLHVSRWGFLRSWKIHAARLEQADYLIEVYLSIDHRPSTIERF